MTEHLIPFGTGVTVSIIIADRFDNILAGHRIFIANPELCGTWIQRIDERQCANLIIRGANHQVRSRSGRHAIEDNDFGRITSASSAVLRPRGDTKSCNQKTR